MSAVLPTALAGCGGDDDGTPAAAGNAQAGRQVWEDAGCGGCHTLAAANATAERAPNLDERIPELEASGDNLTEVVVEQVTNGSTPFAGDMPAFRNELTDQEIADVAAFVIESAGVQ